MSLNKGFVTVQYNLYTTYDEGERPTIEILVASSQSEKGIRLEALIDTGADNSIFDSDATQLLNITLDGQLTTYRGVGGEIKGYLREVYLNPSDITPSLYT